MAITESIYNKPSQQCYKICNYFCFSLWYLFSPYSLLLKCNLKNPEWYSLKQEQSIHCKILSLKIVNKACYKGPKYCKFTRKRNKAKHVILMKKINPKGNITKYIDHKLKNTGTRCKSIRISGLPCTEGHRY